MVPDAPLIVEKLAGSDTTQIEQGIDAVAIPALESNAIQIMWHRHLQITDLKSFLIYKSVAPEGNVNYNRIFEVPVSNIFDPDTVFLDENVNTGQKTFYYITAVSKDNRESSPSDTVWYTLLPKGVVSNFQLNNSTPPVMTFSFQVPTNAFPNEFILRVEEGSLDETSWSLVLIDIWQDFEYGSVSRELSGDYLKIIFKNSRAYRWRIDFTEGDPRFHGSESDWQSIQINWTN